MLLESDIHFTVSVKHNYFYFIGFDIFSLVYYINTSQTEIWIPLIFGRQMQSILSCFQTWTEVHYPEISRGAIFEDVNIGVSFFILPAPTKKGRKKWEEF